MASWDVIRVCRHGQRVEFHELDVEAGDRTDAVAAAVRAAPDPVPRGPRDAVIAALVRRKGDVGQWAGYSRDCRKRNDGLLPFGNMKLPPRHGDKEFVIRLANAFPDEVRRGWLPVASRSPQGRLLKRG